MNENVKTACTGNCAGCLKCAHEIERDESGKAVHKQYDTLHINGVAFSQGNAKVGGTMSVSLNNDFCDPSWPCYQYCYAKKLCAFRAQMKKSYDKNTAIYNSKTAMFWGAVGAAYAIADSQGTGFRWHIDGEMPNAEYFAHIVEICGKFPGVETLLMTKRHDIVNDYCAENGNSSACIPANLHIGFSLFYAGQNIDNPYGFSTRGIIEKSEIETTKEKLCPNQTAKARGLSWTCEDCKRHKCGCFGNESLNFIKH